MKTDFPDTAPPISPSLTAGAGALTVRMVGTGCYVPERIMTNAEMETIVDTSEEWILTRTGISERRIARSGQATSDLAASAARQALDAAGVAAAEVDLIVTATISPDMLMPSTACFVQSQLGASAATCFDLEAACSGFLYSLEVARHLLLAGRMRTALVIGAEKLSAFTDWDDRNTCVLFGDGAGAVVLRAEPATAPARGILSSVTGSDGDLAHLLTLPGGGSRFPASGETLAGRMHYLKMTGREVFKHAVRCMAEAANGALEQCGFTVADVDWIVPHQANLRIIQAIGQRLNVPMDRFYMNLEHYGNMSAASIPVALDEAVRNEKIRPGDVVLMVAFGGGFTWGATVMRW